MALPFIKKHHKKRGLYKADNTTMRHQVCNRQNPSLELKDCDIIGHASVKGLASCPCCNRTLNDERQTVGETRIQAVYGSLFKDDGSETDSCNSVDDMDEEGSMMPGVLSGGTPYTVTKNLVQGWLHKKGTGLDWIGSRAWKPRWAVLSLAKISGHEVEVPLLQIFWHPSSPTPSTLIHLDSAVVLPQDHDDKSKWNCYRFQIIHVRKSVDEHSIQITRSFSCSHEGRDAWCQAISKALLDYEKKKAVARKQISYLSLSPPRWRSLLGWATGDAHPSTAKDFTPVANSPPISPGSPPRDLPRHEPAVIGESFLAQMMDV